MLNVKILNQKKKLNYLLTTLWPVPTHFDKLRTWQKKKKKNSKCVRFLKILRKRFFFLLSKLVKISDKFAPPPPPNLKDNAKCLSFIGPCQHPFNKITEASSTERRVASARQILCCECREFTRFVTKDEYFYLVITRSFDLFSLF